MCFLGGLIGWLWMWLFCKFGKASVFVFFSSLLKPLLFFYFRFWKKKFSWWVFCCDFFLCICIFLLDAWFWCDFFFLFFFMVEKMDRYQRAEKPKANTPIDENEIQITSQGRMRNYITYDMSLLHVYLSLSLSLSFYFLFFCMVVLIFVSFGYAIIY